MIDFFQPDNFQTLASIIMWVVGGTCLLVSGLAAWTLKYIIQVARNTASMAASFQNLQSEYYEINQEVDGVRDDVHKLDKRVTVLENVPKNPIGDCI